MSTPLPGMPELPKRTPKKATVPGVRAVRTKADRLCQLCCEAIHRFGQQVAPYPRMARWRVSDGEVVQRLCEKHKAERCGGNSG